MISDSDLDFWIENDLNVLFEGRHGVGKTAVVTQAFERNKLNWRYFSAATMDPWVDFVGVPEKVVEGDEKFIDLIRPRGFHNGEIEAIFMDELNRAPKKVRNAVMELIQFKSINGVKFPNLKIVWAAINPEDLEDGDVSYDVEALDPAQGDRFEIQVEIPYEPDNEYFSRMYGESGRGAVSWWRTLTDKQKAMVSPRRLEYAIKVWKANGSIRHVLRDNTLNVTKLIATLQSGPIEYKLKKLVAAPEDEVKQQFSDINFTTNAFPLIIKNARYVQKFYKYIPKDMLSDAIVKGNRDSRTIVQNVAEDILAPIVKSVTESGSLTKKKIKTLSSFLGDDFSKHIEHSGPTKTGSREEALEKHYRKINLGKNSSGSVQRYNAVDDVLNNVCSQGSSQLQPQHLTLLLMFISAVVARTQESTLNTAHHQLTKILKQLLTRWKYYGRIHDIYLMDTWAIIRLELSKPGNQKTILHGMGAAKKFSKKELDKIEKFLQA